MRPSIEFARATPAEDQAILALHREAGWPGTQLDGEVWALRESGRLVGSVQLIELAPGLVLIDAVVVGASARGCGIGAEMVQKVLATRRAEWWLECREQRIAFYERLGFTTAPGVEVDQRVRTRVGPNSTRQQHFLRISTLTTDGVFSVMRIYPSLGVGAVVMGCTRYDVDAVASLALEFPGSPSA